MHPETSDNIPEFATSCQTLPHDSLEGLFKQAYGDIGQFLHPPEETPEAICAQNKIEKRKACNMTKKAFNAFMKKQGCKTCVSSKRNAKKKKKKDDPKKKKGATAKKSKSKK